jgi:hypothetical protein
VIVTFQIPPKTNAPFLIGSVPMPTLLPHGVGEGDSLYGNAFHPLPTIKVKTTCVLGRDNKTYDTKSSKETRYVALSFVKKIIL